MTDVKRRYLMWSISAATVAAFCPPSFARQSADAALHARLDSLVNNFHGVAGVYVQNLKTGMTAAVNADTLFPTASMIKVSILCGLFDRIERGELKYDKDVLMLDSLRYVGGAGVAQFFRDSTRIPLAELAWLMIAISDNSAALWCQQLAGGGPAINDWLERNGFRELRVNSRTPGREANREVFGWGQSTPREMARLFTLIRDEKAVSQDASEEMYRVMSKTYWDTEALYQFPPTVKAAAKSGAVDDAKSETVLVNAPSGDYVFCVMTKNQKDQRWEHDNEGYVLIRKISRLLWETFEPESKWSPPAAMDRWMK